jgi:hypothetical protein
VILVYPLALAVCCMYIVRRHGSAAGRGIWWFLAWAVAGFGMSFSFVTGFSIGLFILPFALVALVLIARRSPHWPEASGFVTGTGWMLLLIAGMHLGDESFDARSWFYAGIWFTLAGIGAFVLLSRLRRRAA